MGILFWHFNKTLKRITLKENAYCKDIYTKFKLPEMQSITSIKERIILPVHNTVHNRTDLPVKGFIGLI